MMHVRHSSTSCRVEVRAVSEPEAIAVGVEMTEDFGLGDGPVVDDGLVQHAPEIPTPTGKAPPSDLLTLRYALVAPGTG